MSENTPKKALGGAIETNVVIGNVSKEINGQVKFNPTAAYKSKNGKTVEVDPKTKEQIEQEEIK